MIVTLEGVQGCHRKGQLLLLWSGAVKAVEDIVVGDLLMGPDGVPREVLSLCRGVGNMVEVRPNKGEPWVVNEDHVLSLMWSPRTEDDRKAGKVFDVVVRDHPVLSRNQKTHLLLYRVSVDFPSQGELPLDPYFVGIMLGDGSLTLRGVEITLGKKKAELVRAFGATAAEHGLGIREKSYDRAAASYFATNGNNGYHNNVLLDKMRGLGMVPVEGKDRFVPQVYKTASRDNRLVLLAGLLDSDGSLNGTGFCELTSKSLRLANDLAFVARSVGLAAYVNKREMYTHFGNDNYHGVYWRVGVSGDLGVIPFRRLRPAHRVMKKNVLRTGFRLVPTGMVEPYYGFVLEGDGRYLLADFTVSHNSGKSLSAVAMCHRDTRAGRHIFSNNHLSSSFGDYTFFNTRFFLERMNEEHGDDTDYDEAADEGLRLENATLLLDEAYIYVDSRGSAGKLNKLFTYFIVQTRKRNVDMYVCTHHIDVLDKRLRRAVDVRGSCRYLKESPCRGCKGSGYVKKRGGRGLLITCPRCLGYGHTGWAITDFLHQFTGQRSRAIIQGPAVWHLYDTRELIQVTKKAMTFRKGEI